MNKYQKRKSIEIKAIQRRGDKFGRLSYKEAKKAWQFVKLLNTICVAKKLVSRFCIAQKGGDSL